MIEVYPEHPAEWLPYDIRFPVVASRAAALIRGDVPRVTIEHIGSTAVPGCGGKGVIDLMVVCDLEALEVVKGGLATLGFQPQSTRDPFPESRPMRVGALLHEGRLFRIHVHVLTSGAEEVASLLAFRDRLRVDPKARSEYEMHKRSILAAGIVDPVAYCEAKSKFIQEGLRPGQGSA